MVPDYREGNPYQALLAQEMKSLQHTVEFDSYPYGFFPLIQLLRKHKNTQVLHVHWIAELLRRATWSNNSLIYSSKCLLLLIECWLIRCVGKKVIWTIHNKFAHEGYDRKRELLFRKYLAKGASKVIVHSKEALEQLEDIYGMPLLHKTEVIFHGNYLGVYPKVNQETSELRKLMNIPTSATVVGYFGQIRSYKGIESLIQCINELSERPDIYLVIAGKVSSDEYAETLKNSVKSKNIRLKFEFLSDQDLVNYIEMAHVICLPFADSLTSGSAILAMSCSKALLLSDKAKVFGCVPDEGVQYFETQQQLKDRVEKLDLNMLKRMGNINFAKATEMTWKVVAQKTLAAYAD
jgi:beta-1,4-mannosyltransferase